MEEVNGCEVEEVDGCEVEEVFIQFSHHRSLHYPDPSPLW